MKKYKCDVCGEEYYLNNKEIKHNLKYYGKELPVKDCFENDRGLLIEIENE